MEAKPLFLSLFLVLAAVSTTSATTPGNIDEQGLEKDADLIDELPNQPDSPDFRQYSGYVVTEPVKNRRYFYYFVEAEGVEPSSMPLILYVGTNEREILGSPLLAAFQQVGPYNVDMDGQTLMTNPYSWNKFANLLFVEGPSGIGFSMTDDVQDTFKTFQFSFIAELYHFLAQWMKKFPEHKNTDVYIAGIGDFGQFGPALATFILYQNTKPASKPINIKGIMMGNPGIDIDEEFKRRIESGYRMNTLPVEVYDEYQSVCVNIDVNNFDYMSCWGPLGQAESIRLAIDNNNVYGKACPDINPKAVGLENFRNLVYSCFDQTVTGYLNIPFVQAILHTERTDWGSIIWQPTKGDLFIDRNISSSAVYMRAALNKGVKILAFSAVLQQEAVIPVEGTIKNMNLTISSKWRPWFDKTAQVAGFTESYAEGLTYATVRGAGQKAMADQPERTFVMTKSFIANGNLPSSQYV